MTTDFIRLTYLARSQIAEYERVAWFLFECLERERRLNLKALSASSPLVFMTLMCGMQPAFFYPASTLTFSETEE